MGRLNFFSGVIAGILVLVCFLLVQPVSSQAAEALDVENAVICKDVVNRVPIGSGTNFPATAGKLYCFTKILGAMGETHITHVWYYGNAERFRIDLPVKSAAWRTFSQKTIRPHEIGVWHVDILDAAGNRLEVLNFHIEQ